MGKYNFFGKNPFYNARKCFYWYKKACDSNVGAACNSAAILYEFGVAGVQDIEIARELYTKAISLGDKFAIKNLKTLRKL